MKTEKLIESIPTKATPEEAVVAMLKAALREIERLEGDVQWYKDITEDRSRIIKAIDKKARLLELNGEPYISISYIEPEDGDLFDIFSKGKAVTK